MILVDHNSLSARVAGLLPPSFTVDEVYDHHKDAFKHQDISPPRRQIAFDNAKNEATVGSTCTLVAEQFLASPDSRALLDRSVSVLLLGVIALDTSNGNPAMGKACPRDLQAMAALQPIAGLDRDALFGKLVSAKTDIAFWRGLNVEQCLLLDYKQQPIPTFCHGPEVGVASVLLPVREMLAKPGFAQSFSRFMAADQHDLDMLGIMSFVLEPTPVRELMLITRSPERLEQVRRFLLQEASLALSEVPVDAAAIDALIGCGLHILAFSQQNVKASRKQVLPIVAAFYESIASELIHE